MSDNDNYIEFSYVTKMPRHQSPNLTNKTKTNDKSQRAFKILIFGSIMS
jgi:hypothetical protein